MIANAKIGEGVKVSYGDKTRKFSTTNCLTIVACAMMILVSNLASGCATGPPSYRQNIQSAIGGRGSISVEMRDDGTVILRGWVEDSYSRQAVLRAAHKGEDVTRVISRIYLRSGFLY